MNRVTISFTVEPKVHANLAKRAANLGYRPADYARMLFEAAYAARVRAERGEEDFSSDLDRQVRQVFLLADCEPEFIGQALEIPEARAQKIVMGWRKVLSGIGSVGAVAAVNPIGQLTEATGLEPPPPPIPPSVAVKPKDNRGYDQKTVDTIVTMYNAGKPIPDIAAAVGRPRGSIAMWLSKHRDVCPHRSRPQAASPTGRRPASAAPAGAEGARP